MKTVVTIEFTNLPNGGSAEGVRLFLEDCLSDYDPKTIKVVIETEDK